MEAAEGQIIGGCRIIRRLGSGGMAEVYLAEQIRLKRQVAIKLVREAPAAQPDGASLAARFAREAQAIAAMEHPHILPVYDYGEQDGVAYLVMAYAPNGSLQEALTPGHPSFRFRLPLSVELAGTILDQAAQALQHAHDRGVLHRDVKPANFLLRQRDDGGLHLLLADFGLAKLTASGGNSSVYAGTAVYSAPEQIQRQATAASDQYSLAVMIYLLLTGQPPFSGTLTEVIFQQLEVSPPSLRTLNPAVPAEVDAVVLRALAKKPEDRWPSVAAFAVVYRQAMATAAAKQAAPSQALPQSTSITSISAAAPAQPAVPYMSPVTPVRQAQAGSASALPLQPAVPMQNPALQAQAPTAPGVPASPPTQVAGVTPGLPFPASGQQRTQFETPSGNDSFVGAGSVPHPPVFPYTPAPQRRRRWIGFAALGGLVALIVVVLVVANGLARQQPPSTNSGAGTPVTSGTQGTGGTPGGINSQHFQNVQVGKMINGEISSCQVTLAEPTTTFHEQQFDAIYTVFTAVSPGQDKAGAFVALYNAKKQKVRDSVIGGVELNCPGKANYSTIIDISGLSQPALPLGNYYVGVSYVTDPNNIPPPEVVIPVTIGN
jgi:serine/threonine protein kinase